MIGHIHQHQTDQDFTGVEAVTQQRRDTRPEGAAQHARQRGQRQESPVAHADFVHGEPHRQAAGRNTAHQVLALCADVPDVAAVAQRQPQRAQHQRGGFERQLAERARAVPGLYQKHLQAAHRVCAQGDKHHKGHHHRHDQCDHGRGVAHGARRRGPGFKPPHVRLRLRLPARGHSSRRPPALQWLAALQWTATGGLAPSRAGGHRFQTIRPTPH